MEGIGALEDGLGGGGRRINFARPLGSQGSVGGQQVQVLDSEQEEEEEEEQAKRIVDPEVVRECFFPLSSLEIEAC